MLIANANSKRVLARAGSPLAELDVTRTAWVLTPDRTRQLELESPRSADSRNCEHGRVTMGRRPSDPPGGFGSENQLTEEQGPADTPPPEKAHTSLPQGKKRIGVTMRLFNGYVSMVDSRGESLGTWPAVNVDAKALGRQQYELRLDGIRFTLDTEDDEALLVNLQIEAKRFLEGVGESELTRAATVYHGQLVERQGGVSSSDTDSRDGSLDASSEDSPSDVSSRDRLMVDVFAGEAQQGESHRSKFADTQREVIRWMSEGMLSWLGFYMRLHEGTDHDRRARKTKELEMAAGQLRGIADDLEYFAESGSPRDGLLILVYRDAVLAWAAAFEALSGSSLTDTRLMAGGFRLLDSGTATAQRVIESGGRRRRSDQLKTSLKSLRMLKPPRNVPRALVKRAREPWENALVAAGSPLRWSV